MIFSMSHVHTWNMKKLHLYILINEQKIAKSKKKEKYIFSVSKKQKWNVKQNSCNKMPIYVSKWNVQ